MQKMDWEMISAVSPKYLSRETISSISNHFVEMDDKQKIWMTFINESRSTDDVHVLHPEVHTYGDYDHREYELVPLVITDDLTWRVVVTVKMIRYATHNSYCFFFNRDTSFRLHFFCGYYVT